MKAGDIMSDLIVGRKEKKIKIKKPDGYHTFSIRIKRETVDKLDSIASKTGRTRNEIIGIFLEYGAEHCIIEEKEEP